MSATRTSWPKHATGQPFYTGISYLLVSMECLIGAAYTRQVQAAGLAGAARPAMGRLDAAFADWRIGRFSHHAQLWVDRNFTLDYTLKSLEKLLDGPPCHATRAARVVLKDAAFALLHTMMTLLDRYQPGQPNPDGLDRTLTAHMDAHLTQLRADMATAVHALGPALPAQDAEVLFAEYRPLVNHTLVGVDQRRRSLRHLSHQVTCVLTLARGSAPS